MARGVNLICVGVWKDVVRRVIPEHEGKGCKTGEAPQTGSQRMAKLE